MPSGMQREVFLLVALVAVVDGVFVAAYLLGDVRRASDPFKLGFTVLWTLATLVVVVRGLSRIRRARPGHRMRKD